MSKIWDALAPSARKTLVLAQEESSGLKHTVTSTEHLVLGFARFLEERDPALASELGWSHARLRELVIEIVGFGSGTTGGAVTPRMASLLNKALKLKEATGESVDAGRLMAIFIEDRMGVGAQILYGIGMTDVQLDEIGRRFAGGPL